MVIFGQISVLQRGKGVPNMRRPRHRRGALEEGVVRRFGGEGAISRPLPPEDVLPPYHLHRLNCVPKRQVLARGGDRELPCDVVNPRRGGPTPRAARAAALGLAPKLH